MASWNGPYFSDENGQNYNYIPSAYPESNVQSFPSTAANWTYYQVPSEAVSQPSIGGPQQYSSPVFTNHPLQTVFRQPVVQPVTSRYENQNFRGPDVRYGADEINTYFNPSDLNLPMLATSSLTPTAGEFVPRPTSLHLNTEPGGSTQDKEAYSRKVSGETRQISCDQSNQGFKKPGNSEKYFYSNRNPSSGHNRGTGNSFNRRGIFRGIQPSNVNSRSTTMEKSKNEDRQRLLAEAAAFLTPVGTGAHKMTPSVSDKDRPTDSSLNLEVKHQDINSAYDFKGKGDTKIFTKHDADSLNINYKNFIPQQENSSVSKKKNDTYQYQRNGIGNSSETFISNNGSKMHQQYRNSPGSLYRGSPKKNVRHHGELSNTADDDASQRERLTEQLSRGTLECLVCCDRVRQHDPVWSCSNCYHVLHLKCIKKWAKSSKAESGWRCPACQNVTSKIPYEYRCFCGKMREPEWNRMDAAHSCGQMCGRSRSDKRPDCTHRCTLLCHPGPCPSCVAQVSRNCGCGKKSQIVKCGSDQPLLCGAKCDKKLNCGLHDCTKTCHTGDCTDCEEKITQVCYCGKKTREVPCDSSAAKHFSCDGVCEQKLSCGNHKCSLKCHPGPCPDCELVPEKVTHCCCGQTPLTEEQSRSSCLEPVPTCGLKCNKKLSCGQPNTPHTCQLLCHTEPCPVCPLTTMVRCRCGNMDREIPCQELTTRADDARCEKKCAKKRSCGKHKCNQLCCIDQDHICPLICNHQLSCGQHRCEENCHRGHCPPCWRTSFEELYCECGSSVLYPPVPCGTRRPECTNPCSRTHSCEHPALHNCHSQPVCPPCTVLTQKYCYGKHELRKSVPCHQKELSCGLPCNMELPCGRHRCILPCHKGLCLKDGQNCIQPCTTPRSLCGHNCAAPCHDGPCPDTPCKEMVKVTCECGHRSMSRACSDNAKEYQRIATSLLASKMADMQLGHSVDIGDLMGSPSARKMNLKTLDCTEECRIIERNRRLAIGLQIRNPDLSAKLTPRYSDFMRQWAKKDPHFCNMVHEKLTELVQLAKQSKQKSRSYSFDSMNRDKRHFVHECCEHFGCESVAYDQEPKRNVVATAARDKAWLPSMSLMEVIQRESGQRKIPKPVIKSSQAQPVRVMDVLQGKCSQLQLTAVTVKPTSSVVKSSKEEEEIDYFDLS